MKTLSCSVLILVVLFASFYWWTEYEFNSASDLQEQATVVFPAGTSFEDIVGMMHEKGIIAHPTLFKVQVYLRGKASRFKAGEYAFAPHISPASVADMIASGKSVMRHLTVAEGLMTSEVIELLNNEKALSGDITLDIKEGELLPETYYFSFGDKRNDMLMRMKNAMDKALEEAWAARAEGLPVTTPEQALVLASIVEKETGIDAERARVAAVYVNRLKKGMLLQADPTTVYAITLGKSKLDRQLSLKDLAMESPYNTYRSMGLPIGPIANPGKASLHAALHPAKTEDLYFVATGKGGHSFAKSGEEHQANVKVYREAQRKAAEAAANAPKAPQAPTATP